jgi:hypothetical protein
MLALGRKAILSIKNRSFVFPDLYYEFEINFNTDSDGNTGNIKLFNLSDLSIGLFVNKQTFLLSAGYKDDIGTIFPGVVSSSSTAWEGTEKITTVIVGDHTDSWLTAPINKSWRAGILASTVAKDISAELGLGVGEMTFPKDLVYKGGKVFSCTCKRALEELARDLGVKLHVSRGKVYFRAEKVGSKQVVLLNYNTGLIGNPQKMDKTNEKGGDRWLVNSLLNYRIEADSVVKIESRILNGLFRVAGGKHRSAGDEWLTEMEVVKYGT